MDPTVEKELIYLLQIIIASVLTGFIGYERGSIHKPAGVRTNMIVGGAVCLLVLQGETMVDHFIDLGYDDEIINVDPTRILQAIIVGISFIGAGIVMHDKKQEEIKYLTSSATILFSTGVGISVALEQYVLAIGVTVISLIINRILGNSWIKEKQDSNNSE
jgi:putative Mg2+ transporter-C (MgtC) family protein